MTSEEARKILAACRPGGGDDGDPQMQAALARARQDPELGRWFAEQQAFDAMMAEGMRAIAVPVDLRRELLASRPRVVRRPVNWWRSAWSGWPARATAAAAIVLMAAVVAGAFARAHPTRFADFRQKLIKESWESENHLAFRSSDFVRVRQWLAQNGGPAAFNLPMEFRQRILRGCNLVDVGGQPVAVLCFVHGSQHLHLYVAESVQFAGLPLSGTPDFEQCGQWKTTAWQDGKRTFVLSGMNYPTFVTTFRKAGRWTMSG
jgi:hypothetical protein